MRQLWVRLVMVACWGSVMLAAVGCGGDARVELAAADALVAAADRMQAVLDEYHAEMAAYDDSREEAVTQAFIERVKAAPADEGATASHAAQFRSALSRIRADRSVQWRRHIAGVDNIEAMREVAGGLRRLGVESLTMQDDLRRYLNSWIEARNEAKAARALPVSGANCKGVQP